jgi:hypothetical protein
MEEEVRDRVLREVGVGLLQRRLLGKASREAWESGWARG